eukprot:1386120-Amorphochlora_amoeboformis.AAC.2
MCCISSSSTIPVLHLPLQSLSLNSAPQNTSTYGSCDLSRQLWKTKIRTSGALNESRPGIVLGMPEAQTMDAKSYGVPVYSALQVPMVPPAPSVPLGKPFHNAFTLPKRFYNPAPKAEASSSLTRKRNHVESKSAPPEKKARVVNDVADELTLDVSDEDEDEDEDEDDLGRINALPMLHISIKRGFLHPRSRT